MRSSPQLEPVDAAPNPTFIRKEQKGRDLQNKTNPTREMDGPLVVK